METKQQNKIQVILTCQSSKISFFHLSMEFSSIWKDLSDRISFRLNWIEMKTSESNKKGKQHKIKYSKININIRVTVSIQFQMINFLCISKSICALATMFFVNIVWYYCFPFLYFLYYFVLIVLRTWFQLK